MKEIRINLLELVDSAPTGYNTSFTPVSARRLPTKLLLVACSGVFVLVSTSVFSFTAANNEDSKLSKTLRAFDAITHFAINSDRSLKGEKEDRINVVLLGVGGDDHEGGQLADTIIIASIQPSTHKVSLVSIPRDLLVNIEGHGWRKVNNANAFGEMKEAGTGPELMRATLQKAFNLPIHYYIKVDFPAFTEIVDILGGLPVVVDQNFTDYTYPTLDKKYQTVSFKAGPQVMSGDEALKFGRSRHSGMNGEGSDFARSRRQQKLLAAFKEKLISGDILLKPQKINDIINSLQSHVVTDIQSWEMIKFATLAKDVDTQHMLNLVLDDGPNGYLYPENVEGAYVLQPRGGNFNTIQEKMAQIFTGPSDSDSTITSRKPRVIVKNGTKVAGLAGRTAEDVKAAGFTVLSFGNATNQEQEQTVIYNLSESSFATQADKLKSLLKAEIRDGSMNTEDDPYKTYADFLIILGKDFTNEMSGVPTSDY